ncbi:MAG: hypothetical protein ACM3ML_11785 [Micromonosporaceae bacterium]
MGAGRSAGRSLAVLGAVTAAVALLGVPAGLVWTAVAPRVTVVVTGHGAAQVVNPETKAFIAGDGWFCVIGLVGGLVVGLAGYLLAVRRRGAPAMAGLILGGLAASLIAWWIGRNDGLAAFHRALLTSRTGAVLHAPLMLRAHGAVVVWPLATALAGGLAELLTGQARPASPIGAASKLGT